MTYLDNNATTVPPQGVVDAVTAALGDQYGNPSSPHRAGETARGLLGDARDEVAGLLRCASDHVLFAGSGTEANNLALHSLVGQGASRLITTPVEHSSVLAHANALAARGLDVLYTGVTASGRIELDDLDRLLSGAEHPALSVQWVNNETGIIQPIEEVVALAREHSATVHIDAAQAVGKLPSVDVSVLDPDFLTFAGHKMNAPRGVGAMYMRDPRRVYPLRFGGDQENGLHPGTENLPAIAGLGTAARLRRRAFDADTAHMQGLRDTFEARILEGCPWVEVNGVSVPRVGNTSNIRFCGIDGQALMARLDGEGIYCSQTSACVGQKPEPSYVLRAMGLSEEQAYESVRFSTGVLNTEDEVVEAADTVVSVANQLRRLFA